MKKVLSWVLTLALVLGSFTMAFAGDTANSDQFTDNGDIQNVEAVDVMVATGIINGYSDNTFKPAKTVTRAEMAKMITIAKNGGEDVGDLYKSSCTFADSVNHWAAGYIGYCAGEGIIDGRSETTFDPDATVTGVEAAKMMLIAIGYDSKIEGFTGSQWATKVLSVAKKSQNDLFDGCDNFDSSKALTRDNASQIIFNGLNAQMVEYDYGTDVTIGDTKVSVNTKCDYLWEDNAKTKAKKLYTDLFNKDSEVGELKCNSSGMDDFCSPATAWKLDGDEIGTYADEEDFSFVADDNETLAEQLDNFDDSVFENKTTKEYALKNVYVNGTNDVNLYTASVEKGDVIEMYDVTDGEDVDQYIAVIKRYVANEIESIDVDVSDEDAEDGIYAYVELTSWNGNDDELVGFDKATYVEDALVAVAYNASGEPIDSYVIEAEATGEWTKNYTSKMTVDGTSYNKFSSILPIDSPAVDDDVELYMINGYVAAVKKVEDGGDVVYGILFAKGQSTFASDIDTVKIMTADGSVVTYDLEDEGDTMFNKTAGSVVAYSINDDGEAVGEPDGIYTTTTLNKDKDMNSKGLMGGKEVLDDVVVFDFDGGDADDEDNYTILGYADLADAEDVVGTAYVNSDGDIAAVYTTNGVTASDTMVAFLTELNSVNSGKYYEVSLMISGEENDYDTVKVAKMANVPDASMVGNPVVVKFNADGEVTSVESATAGTSQLDPTDDFGSADYITCTKSGLVTARDGNKLTVDGYIINVEGAAIYKTVAGELDADNYKVSAIKAGVSEVTIYQFSEDSDTWDVVVIK